MNPEPAPLAGARPTAEKAPSNLSRMVRQTHMYLALFLAPWMAMYALSTLGMAHRGLVASFYSTKSPSFTKERELDYSRDFSPDVSPAAMAKTILVDLNLDGAHRVSGLKNGKPLVIERQHALGQRRITFDPATHRIVVEREESRGLTFLERLHRRRGYQHPYALEDTWAFSVDLTVTVMVFWSLSGLWLWWELRPTRRIGCWCLGIGIALFATFLALI